MDDRQRPVVACEVLTEYFASVKSGGRIRDLIDPEITPFFPLACSLLSDAPFEMRIAMLKVVSELLDEKPIFIPITIIQQGEFLGVIMDLLDSGDENVMLRSLEIIRKILQTLYEPMVPLDIASFAKNVLLSADIPLLERLESVSEEAESPDVHELIDEIQQRLEQIEQDEEL